MVLVGVSCMMTSLQAAIMSESSITESDKVAEEFLKSQLE